MKRAIEQIKNASDLKFKVKKKIFELSINFSTNRAKLFNAFNNLILWDKVFQKPELNNFKFYLIDTREINLPIVFDTPENFKLQKKIGEIEYYIHPKNNEILFIQIYKSIRFYIDLEEKLVFGALVLGKIYSDDFLAQFIIFPILDFILKDLGYFSIHSGGIVKGRKAVIFPARKESGKTTLSLYLARNGFGFLGDETIYGTSAESGVELFGFPRQIKLYNDSIKFFPEISKLNEFKDIKLKRFKVRFPVDKLLNLNIKKKSGPGFIIFPSRGKRFSIKPLKKIDAVKYIVPESAEFIGKKIAVEYLDFIHKLIDESRVFKLVTGSDLDLVTREISGLFQ
ncbi:hypothetical protein KAU33_08410 [Candidatus Dependentiae bacterium]|nr:hypothetical protein [Candidatus Dependentiae bacterium]